MPCDKTRLADTERGDQCLGVSPRPELFRHAAPLTETPCENNRLNIYSILERILISVFESEFESYIFCVTLVITYALLA